MGLGLGIGTRTGICQNVHRLFDLHEDQREGGAMGFQNTFQFDRLLFEAHSRACLTSASGQLLPYDSLVRKDDLKFTRATVSVTEYFRTTVDKTI